MLSARAPYGAHAAGFGSVHLRAIVHAAGAMHVMSGPHGDRSAAVGWHRPCPLLSTFPHDSPRMHATMPPSSRPHGSLVVVTRTGAHTLWKRSQNAPCALSQSVIDVHAPPAGMGVWHLPPTHESDRRHGCDSLHGAPTTPGPAHTPRLHTSVAEQSPSSTHGPPAPECGEHVPQMVPGLGRQLPLWHCVLTPQPASSGRAPGIEHAEGCALSRASSQDSPSIARAHASMSVAVACAPGAPRPGAHVSSMRDAHVATSP